MEENIFEISKKGSKLGKKETIPEREKIFSSNKPKQDPEIAEMLQKMHNMKNDLENQLDAIYRQGKEKQIRDTILIDHISGLTTQQLKELQEQERVLMDQIHAAIPPESCLRSNPKSKETLTRERQGKLRGARNKWIPIR